MRTVFADKKRLTPWPESHDNDWSDTSLHFLLRNKACDMSEITVYGAGKSKEHILGVSLRDTGLCRCVVW